MSEPGPHTGTFRIPTASQEAAKRLKSVLAVETQAVPEGTTVDLQAEDTTVVLVVAAPAARSLRAAVNSFLRLVAVAVDVDADEAV